MYRGQGGTWFISNPAQTIDYQTYCKSRYRPEDFPAFLTRKEFKSSSLTVWHDAPLPLPHIFSEIQHPCSVRFKMTGGVVGKMPWIQLDGQVFELGDDSSKIMKHCLGGRISLVLEQLKWNGPWGAMMTRENRLRYTDMFRKMDVDNSGTVDGGELSFAFEHLGLVIDDHEILLMVQKHAKKHAAEMEVTLNEFFEMIEDKTHLERELASLGISNPNSSSSAT